MKMKRNVIFLTLVLSFLFAQTAAANLVVNGGFETGDFSSWTQSGNTTFTGVLDDTIIPVHSGTQAAVFGPVGPLGYISQILDTTPGQSYNLSFWLYNSLAPSVGQPNEIQVFWNGAVISDQFNLPLQDYTLYNFVVQATGSTTDLIFGLRNDPGSFILDDISVSCVPVPATAILLGSGLLGLIGLRRFRKI